MTYLVFLILQNWFANLKSPFMILSKLLANGFLSSPLSYINKAYDYFLFIKLNGSTITLDVVYVYDIVITGDNMNTNTALKQRLQKYFSIKDISLLKFFLGIELVIF